MHVLIIPKKNIYVLGVRLLPTTTVPGQVVLWMQNNDYRKVAVLRTLWHSDCTRDNRARAGCLVRYLDQRCISDMGIKCNKTALQSTCLWQHICWRTSSDSRPGAGCLSVPLNPESGGRQTITKKTNNTHRSRILWGSLWHTEHKTIARREYCG